MANETLKYAGKDARGMADLRTSRSAEAILPIDDDINDDGGENRDEISIVS